VVVHDEHERTGRNLGRMAGVHVRGVGHLVLALSLPSGAVLVCQELTDSDADVVGWDGRSVSRVVPLASP
jgi:hypothetical protein